MNTPGTAYLAMVSKQHPKDRRKAMAFDLLKVGGFLNRSKAAEALRIARRLIKPQQPNE